MNAPELTLFYDRKCAICRAEMMRLAKWDAAGRLRMVDSSAADFDAGAYGFTAQALDRELHGISAGGEVLKGLAAVRRAYALTRYGWLWKITAWPGLKPGFDRFYLWFARNRLAISRWLFIGRAQPGTETAPACLDACARKLKGS
jgi:predicted DCC family thiol-disulfide oxidoreductase YuxK